MTAFFKKYLLYPPLPSSRLLSPYTDNDEPRSTNDIPMKDGIDDTPNHDNLRRALANFNNTIMIATSPYYNPYSNLQAFMHPLFHTTQLVRNLFQLALHVFFLIETLVASDLDFSAQIAVNMGYLIIAIFIEALNIALSVISLATRLVASIANLGYTSNTLYMEEDMFYGDTSDTPFEHDYIVNSTAFSFVA